MNTQLTMQTVTDLRNKAEQAENARKAFDEAILNKNMADKKVDSTHDDLARAKEDLRIYLLSLGHVTPVLHRTNHKTAQGATAHVTHREPSGLPPIKQSIVQVLSGQIMNAKHVYEKLVELKLMPPSNDPQSYVATVLASNADEAKKETFQRVDRGLYTVRGASPKEDGFAPTQNQATG